MMSSCIQLYICSISSLFQGLVIVRVCFHLKCGQLPRVSGHAIDSPRGYINSGLRYGRQGRKHQIVNPTLTAMTAHGPTVGGDAAVGDGETGCVDFGTVGGCGVNMGGTSVLGVGGISVIGERGG